MDHNLARSTLPPQSRFLQEEREKYVDGGALFSAGKKVSCETDVFLFIEYIFFHLGVLSCPVY